MLRPRWGAEPLVRRHPLLSRRRSDGPAPPQRQPPCKKTEGALPGLSAAGRPEQPFMHNRIQRYGPSGKRLTTLAEVTAQATDTQEHAGHRHRLGNGDIHERRIGRVHQPRVG